MSIPVVSGVINPYNGMSVDLQLAAAPSGTLKIFASRIPDDYGVEVAPTSLGSNRYRVSLPVPVTTGRAPQLWYFTVHDNEGYSTYRGDDGVLMGQAAVWIGTTYEDELTDIMKKLHRRVMDNLAGVNARLGAIEPSCEVKNCIWGMSERIEAYPAIEINQAAFSEPYIGTPMIRYGTVTADIYGYIEYQNPLIEAELITAMGRALQRILNQDAYEQMVCMNDTTLVGCQAINLTFDNNIWNGTRFVSSFSLQWQGGFGETID